MKRRRWWFIGLGVALLAACVGVWKWSERPRILYLEGATLLKVSVSYGTSVETFALPDRVSQGAWLRGVFGHPGLSSSTPSNVEVTYYDSASEATVYLMSSLPKERRILVVYRPARRSDRVRAWFYRVKNGGRPW